MERKTNVSSQVIQGVGGSETLKIIHDVEFYLQIDSRSNQWTKVTADINVKVEDNSISNLLGRGRHHPPDQAAQREVSRLTRKRVLFHRIFETLKSQIQSS